MDKLTKKELIITINEQKEQLKRYETRLRDVVAAYKGLIKEKEALEASLRALSGANPVVKVNTKSNTEGNPREVTAQNEKSNTENSNEESADEPEIREETEETVEQLRSQLTTLMNSLATLSAEKSRMEASFQADKKQLRQEKEEREKLLKELQEKHQMLARQHELDFENLRTKLALEHHEREKEQSDHGVMIRELQKLVSDERKLREQAESQLEELRGSTMQQYERRLRDLRNELEATRRKLRHAEEAPPLLVQLQDEMAEVKAQHQAAIFEEQKRVAEAEERAKRLAAIHEERVANLEARLAELSETVGTYDRLRQQDQIAIQKLKERLVQLDIEKNTLQKIKSEPSEEDEPKANCEVDPSLDIQELVDKILYLRSQLLLVNQNSEKPIDIQEILNVGYCFDGNNLDQHKTCREEYQRLKEEFELYRSQQEQLQQQFESPRKENGAEIASLKNQVKALKDRIHTLNNQLDDTEAECKEKVEQIQKLLKGEQAKYKDELASMDADYRGRLSLLEHQLQKQRERSLALLEEKEQEIRTLKTTFQMFLPGNAAVRKGSPTSQEKEMLIQGGSDVMSQFGGVTGAGGGGDSPHMLHYAHELARRDVEISNLRKAKHSLDAMVRESQRSMATQEEAFNDKINELQEEVARLQRCQSREGANLEYLKNVVLSFLLTSDTNSKRHMLNAIAAVLKFSSAELEKVAHSHKSLQPLVK